MADVSVGIHGIKSITRTHVHHFMCHLGNVNVQLARSVIPVIVMDVKRAESIGFGNKRHMTEALLGRKFTALQSAGPSILVDGKPRFISCGSVPCGSPSVPGGS